LFGGKLKQTHLIGLAIALALRVQLPGRCGDCVYIASSLLNSENWREAMQGFEQQIGRR
jgi:hypothetical protein